ncbi:hypothetical protein AAFN87_04695 [Solibacillus sp. CAU 1738]
MEKYRELPIMAEISKWLLYDTCAIAQWGNIYSKIESKFFVG